MVEARIFSNCRRCHVENDDIEVKLYCKNYACKLDLHRLKNLLLKIYKKRQNIDGNAESTKMTVSPNMSHQGVIFEPAM